jgi:hypothetical protein
MISGNKEFEDIVGIDKILKIHPNFKWSDIQYIEKIYYYMDYDENFGTISNLKIQFKILDDNRLIGCFWFKFNEISSFSLSDIGGKYNQITGFEVVDNRNKGWLPENNFFVNDYEEGTLKFYCRSITVE